MSETAGAPGSPDRATIRFVTSVSLRAAQPGRAKPACKIGSGEYTQSPKIRPKPVSLPPIVTVTVLVRASRPASCGGRAEPGRVVTRSAVTAPEQATDLSLAKLRCPESASTAG